MPRVVVGKKKKKWQQIIQQQLNNQKSVRENCEWINQALGTTPGTARTDR